MIKYKNSIAFLTIYFSGDVVKFVNCPKPSRIAFYQKGKCYFVSEHATNTIKRISLTGRYKVFYCIVIFVGNLYF